MKTSLLSLILTLLSLSAKATYLNLDTEPKGAYFGEGYKFSLKGSKWIQALPPKSHPALKAIYKSPSGESSLTIRESNLNKKVKLKTHVQSWIKDYRKYGLNLRSSKPLKMKDQKGFLIDSEHIVTKKIFRQLIMLKDKKSITLTCKTNKGSKELIECAELIKNFSWSAPTSSF